MPSYKPLGTLSVNSVFITDTGEVRTVVAHEGDSTVSILGAHPDALKLDHFTAKHESDDPQTWVVLAIHEP